MERNILFVFFGGTMSGVFGAGVATSLQRLDLYDKIHSIYACSAGVHNAAYFLAQESSLGSSIYYEDLIDDKFIKRNRRKFIYRLCLHMISRRAILEKLVDIDYLMDIEKNKKKLDTDKIAKSKIGFFIKAFNIETKKDEYLDGKIDTLKKMQATSAVIPFYPHSIKIHDHHYADGSVFSEISDPLLENLIAENRDKKIFLVFNNHRTTRVSLTSILENFIRTILLMFYFRKTFILRKLNIFSENRKLKKYLQYPNVKIIEPDFDFSPFCTDKEKILQLYANGMLKAQESMIENDIISK